MQFGKGASTVILAAIALAFPTQDSGWARQAPVPVALTDTTAHDAAPPIPSPPFTRLANFASQGTHDADSSPGLRHSDARGNAGPPGHGGSEPGANGGASGHPRIGLMASLGEWGGFGGGSGSTSGGGTTPPADQPGTPSDPDNPDSTGGGQNTGPGDGAPSDSPAGPPNDPIISAPPVLDWTPGAVPFDDTSGPQDSPNGGGPGEPPPSGPHEDGPTAPSSDLPSLGPTGPGEQGTDGNDNPGGPTHVPEPASFCFLLAGLAGLGALRRRRR
jgi:hypothetical protein